MDRRVEILVVHWQASVGEQTMTGLVQDDRFRKHWTGEGHPERPDRLAAIARSFQLRGLTERCRSIKFAPISLDVVRRVHDEDYLQRLERACAENRDFIDVPDSGICSESFEIARLAAGAVIAAVDEVMAGRIDNAFCALRPPGHHAERNESMGFCLLNNVAIAAQYLMDRYGLSRVLILDWDVHHGNGTQHIFEADPRVLFISIHGHPGILYPGTGYARERGIGAGEGFTLNCPMLPPSGDTEYREVFDDPILPAIRWFAPEFVLISAGFDAHVLDPLAPLELPTESFGWMTDAMTEVAERFCGGRLVSVLEGGYHLEALGDCTALHVARLMAVSDRAIHA
jgi:acetoin utilization deacetylase AcuC-like enzyme